MEGYDPNEHIELGMDVSDDDELAQYPSNLLIHRVASLWGTYIWEKHTEEHTTQDYLTVIGEINDIFRIIARREGFTLEGALSMVVDIVTARNGIFYNDVFIKEADFTVDLLTDAIKSGTLGEDSLNFAIASRQAITKVFIF